MTLEKGLRRFADWFWGAALPLWSERAADAEGAFFESLNLAGEPDRDEPRRTRVQARQVHVFATAARLRSDRVARTLAERGFEYLLAHACPEGGRRGAVHLLAPDGEVLDERRDLYDQAFALLACASVWRTFSDPRALALARSVVSFLDRELRSPGGGYLEDDRGSAPRRQNPHMHLFEAFSALGEAAGEPAFTERAGDLLRLLDSRFLDRREGALREYFSPDLKTPDPAKGELIEPGHMAEWVWLLDRHHRGSPDVSALIAWLYRGAIRHGEDAAGFLVDSVRLGERPWGPRRLWPQTEHLKASLVMTRRGETGAEARAMKLIDGLFADYLDRPSRGLWRDRIDPGGRMLADAVPASILYHLMEAALEAEARLGELP